MGAGGSSMRVYQTKRTTELKDNYARSLPARHLANRLARRFWDMKNSASVRPGPSPHILFRAARERGIIVPYIQEQQYTVTQVAIKYSALLE
jgi:hypothetical protein